MHRIGRTGRAGQSGLAITLVARDDMRLVSDIEKLIKKKLEIEPFEFEDERPRRPRRTEAVEPEAREEREAPRVPRAEPRRAPVTVDPFFDRPYEPSPVAEATGGDAAVHPPAAPSRGVGTPNIRAKKKVAALLGGVKG